MFLSTERIKLWTFQKTIKPGRKSQVLVPWELSHSGPVLARSRPGEEENCRLNKAGTKTREKREVGCWPREFLVGSCDTSQVREKTCGGWQGKLLTTTHIFSSLLFFSFCFVFLSQRPPCYLCTDRIGWYINLLLLNRKRKKEILLPLFGFKRTRFLQSGLRWRVQSWVD
jgi:hypothetical protein